MKQLLPLLILPLTTARKQQHPILSIPDLPDFSSLVDLSLYKPPGLQRSYDPTNPNDSCYTPLYESDSNEDGTIDHEEYVTFINTLDSRLGKEEFMDLAFVLKVNFVYLSCLCDDGENNCCKVGGNGNISTAGAGPIDTPTDAQIEYLDTVCSTTQASIDYAIKELPPSPQPTISPSYSPSASPIESPTVQPSNVPTENPSASPIESPTVPPTSIPTESPVVITDAPVATDSPVVTTAPTYLERTEAPFSTDSPIGSDAPFASAAPSPSSSGVIIPPTPSVSEEPTLATSSPFVTSQPSVAPSSTDSAIIDGGNDDTATTTTISSGGIAAIVLASAAFVAVGIVFTRKSRTYEEDPSLEFKKGDLEMGDLGGRGDGPSPEPSPTNADADSTSAAPDVVPVTPESQLECLQALSPPTSPALDRSPYSPQRQNVESSADDSSSAGQSGWSSSQGLSSLNTASYDAAEDRSLPAEGLEQPTFMAGSALAAIGVASAVTYQTVQKSSPPMKQRFYNENDDDSISSDEGLPAVSRKELDAAIEAGDWAAVGATAALLANSSGPGSSSENQQVIQSMSQISALDDRRAQELDKLVEAGDWEGVVLAAAQFEGQPDVGSHGGSQDHVWDDGSEPSLLARGGNEKLENIRAEVELLVRRIVPDEIDNIDDMMIQFQGREHELIETLKTMQERSKAQREQAAVKQSAKLEARSRGQNFSSGGGGESTSTASKSYIEQAAEQGDWQAVGQAAAMMRGGPVVHDDSLNRSRTSSISSSLSDSRSRSLSRDSTLSRDKSERIQHLDNLIAVGDWAGIVAAASQYQAMDEEINPGPQDNILASEEERDALAQAEMWRAIAQQSKQDISSASEGAKEAADWAIERSLLKHSGPTSSEKDQPDMKKTKIGLHEDQSV